MILAGENAKYPGIKLLHCQFFNYKFQTDRPWIKTGTPW
jgi:hypothetical protein